MSVGCTRGCPARVRPVHPRVCVGCVVGVFPAPAWGCKGRSSHGSSTPCPWAVRVYSLVSRESPTLVATRYAPRARAIAPAPRRTARHTVPRRLRTSVRFVLADGASKLAPHERCVLFCRSSRATKLGLLAVPSDVHHPRLSGRCRRSVVAMFWARFRGNRLLSVSPNCNGRTETQTAGSLVSQC